jgi:hypothetical protein
MKMNMKNVKNVHIIVQIVLIQLPVYLAQKTDKDYQTVHVHLVLITLKEKLYAQIVHSHVLNVQVLQLTVPFVLVSEIHHLNVHVQMVTMLIHKII